MMVFAAVTTSQQPKATVERSPSTDSANSQTATTVDALTTNDQLMLNAFRSIHSAEMTYQAMTGEYTFLSTLGQAGLIDPQLASASRYGYLFIVSFYGGTAQMMPGFDVRARPRFPVSTKTLSFYMDQSCDIRGAYHAGGGFGDIRDPVIEPCGTSQLTENERLSIASLREIYNAEITYQSTIGAGQFGTLAQLYNANLVTTGFAASPYYRDYRVNALIIIPEPAGFSFTVLPLNYGRSGRRSFYIDQTGVLRGADKSGLPANENDPPIS